MRYPLMVTALLCAVIVGIPTRDAVAEPVDATVGEASFDAAEDATMEPLADVAMQSDEQYVTPMLTSSITYQMQYPMRPSVPFDQLDDEYFGYGYGYIPGDYSREGFLIEDWNWWIGNQPFLPYFGYNPPTINGYYPPYAFRSPYAPGYIGYNPPNVGQYGQIVPAPPLAQPPGYVPAIRIPIPPAPTRISRAFGGGYVVERDPNFQLFWAPQPPSYVTSGAAIYQQQSPYFPYPYAYPFPFPPPIFQ